MRSEYRKLFFYIYNDAKLLHYIIEESSFYSGQNNILVSPVRRLFDGGAYLKGSYHKDITFLTEQFYLRHEYFSWLTGLKNWRTQRFWRENWMKECQDILTSNRKTSLLMKINSHCWLRTALQRLQHIFIIFWKYSNKRRTAAAVLIISRAALINFSTPCAVLNRGQHLFKGGTYSSKYGTKKATC